MYIITDTSGCSSSRIGHGAGRTGGGGGGIMIPKAANEPCELLDEAALVAIAGFAVGAG